MAGRRVGGNRDGALAVRIGEANRRLGGLDTVGAEVVSDDGLGTTARPSRTCAMAPACRVAPACRLLGFGNLRLPLLAKSELVSLRLRSGGMSADDATRLKALKQQNAKLKRLLADRREAWTRRRIRAHRTRKTLANRCPKKAGTSEVTSGPPSVPVSPSWKASPELDSEARRSCRRARRRGWPRSNRA